MQFRLPTIEDVREAASRIAPYAVRTPLLESAFLNDRIGARVLLKAEVLQRTGSFKFRGAYNCISRIGRDAYPGGVVACSSGNHAQGVAEAARLCGMPAVIVMPLDAPAVKVARTQRSGAEVVRYDRYTEDRDAIAARIAKERGAQFVAPFDNFHVIAGQGTAGLEIVGQAKEAGADLSAVLVPCSGGGLASGVALSVTDGKPGCQVYAVEPEACDDFGRSLRSGQRERNATEARSICDSLLIPQPGELTFALGQTRMAGGIAVPDADTRAAIAFAFNELKLSVEPGGAIALAALLAGHFKPAGKPVAVILSGGNIDPEMLFASLAS
jgi:threonine dehydratase